MQILKDRERLRVYSGAVPLGMGNGEGDVPTLEVFLPKGKASGASFVVCPGGGYQHLAEHETTPPGLWFAELGITAFVLRYRLHPPYRHPTMMLDGMRAVRMVRHHAEAWGLDRKRIGILGFSAGGHLAATVSTLFDAGNPEAGDGVDRESSRPDASILVYPVITMKGFGHSGSKANLLGANTAAELVERMSLEGQVSGDTPPTFLVHSTQDDPVPVANSDAYAEALARHGVAYGYVRGEYGGHGFGMREFWTKPAEEWLRGMGWR